MSIVDSTKQRPTDIFATEDVRAMDAQAIAQCGISGYALMLRAAKASVRVLLSAWPQARCVTVLVGVGNNAGDGYLIAHLLRTHQLDVRVMTVLDAVPLRGDALRAAQKWQSGGGGVSPYVATQLDSADVIVDAILGTGLNRDVGGSLAEVITTVNQVVAPVLSVDIPSGLDSDSGRVRGVAIRADHTVTFVALKPGLFLMDAKGHCGHWHFSTLGIPAWISENFRPCYERIGAALLKEVAPPRAVSAHKGLGGHVLIVGGGVGMPGAARLTGCAALRSGAGTVRVMCHQDSVAAIASEQPELMVHAVARNPDAQMMAKIQTELARSDVVVLGPGLGRDEWARRIAEVVLSHAGRCVVDADGLYWLSQLKSAHAERILTPHPGEAAQLGQQTIAQVEIDRRGTAQSLCTRYNAVTVLKGHVTEVHEAPVTPPSSTHPGYICSRGTQALATAGSGDVLAGIIGGLWAQQCRRGQQEATAFEVAAAAVRAHAVAGEMASAQCTRGLLASDLLASIPSVLESSV